MARRERHTRAGLNTEEASCMQEALMVVAGIVIALAATGWVWFALCMREG